MPKLSAVLLVLFGQILLLAACNSTASPTIATSPNQWPTETHTLTPTLTATNSVSPSLTPSPTETDEPVIYASPMPYDQLLHDAFYRENFIAGMWHGGYFVGDLNIENPIDYFVLDFSHQGKIRIIQGDQVEPTTWGIFLPKNTLGYGIADIIGRQALNEQRSYRVEWGDFSPGTEIFIYDLVNDINIWKGHLNEIFPFADGRYLCSQVDSYIDVNGESHNETGTLCEYIGNP